MNDIKISIVTPSFNQGEFIEKCIQSVLDQQYVDFEHIIVDNCSTDETAEVLLKYPHIKLVCEPDKGQCDAINKGVLAASGEWILWLNADDYLLPNALSTYSDAIRQNPKASIIYSHMQFVDENEKLIKISYNIKYHYFLTKYGAFMPPSTGSIFKTQFFSDNPLNINYHYVMDAEWFLRCGNRVQMELVDRVNFAFRVSAENKTSAYAKTGTLVPRHAEEREMYKREYVFPVGGKEPLAHFIYTIFHYIAVFWFKGSKLKYVFRYMANKLHKASS